MEESIFNIEPQDIKVPKCIHTYNYNFLDQFNYNINHSIYYQLINSMEHFKLKKLYNYLYLRTFKINKQFPEVNYLPKVKKNINEEELNQLFYNYIDNDDIKSIIIMNGIQLFFFPKII